MSALLHSLLAGHDDAGPSFCHVPDEAFAGAAGHNDFSAIERVRPFACFTEMVDQFRLAQADGAGREDDLVADGVEHQPIPRAPGMAGNGGEFFGTNGNFHNVLLAQSVFRFHSRMT